MYPDDHVKALMCYLDEFERQFSELKLESNPMNVMKGSDYGEN